MTAASSVSTDSNVECLVCDANQPSETKRPSHEKVQDAIQSIFTQLIRQVYFVESKRCRVAAMIALRRVVVHSLDPDFMNLETSGTGQWCLQSLNSSIRELRIASGRTLISFLPSKTSRSVDSTLLARNRQNSIALLKSASEGDAPHMVETRIMAWGQLGRVVNNEELNLVLIKLLEYLGSGNSVESAVAFNELLNLAEARRTTTRRLIEPFWKSLAYMVTKDMVHRPQRSRAMADLLQISVNELLLLVQTYALPWLVLDKRIDVIQRIAEARQDKEIWSAIVDTANLAPVLSLLMIQEPKNIEEYAKSRLDAISPHFHSLPLLELIQTEQAFVATELLKAAADGDETKKQSVSFFLSFRGPLHTDDTKCLHIYFSDSTGTSLDGKCKSKCKQGTEIQKIKHHWSLPPASCSGSHGASCRCYYRSHVYRSQHHGTTRLYSYIGSYD